MITEKGILYIEPSSHTSVNPIIDQLTRKMTAAFRFGIAGPGYRGFHLCNCGVSSSNCDYTLPNGEETNSLCIHYLAYHRDEIPESQLAKVQKLRCGEADPTTNELKRPHR